MRTCPRFLASGRFRPSCRRRFARVTQMRQKMWSTDGCCEDQWTSTTTRSPSSPQTRTPRTFAARLMSSVTAIANTNLCIRTGVNCALHTDCWCWVSLRTYVSRYKIGYCKAEYFCVGQTLESVIIIPPRRFSSIHYVPDRKTVCRNFVQIRAALHHTRFRN